MISLQRKARVVYRRLRELHPDAKIELNFKNPLELLVATVLSAQCTDVKVNQVTKELFQKYRTPEDYVKCPEEDLEKIIRPTGFFRQKAKNIRAAMKIISEQYAGEVSADMEVLIRLPGIGRKTANVILGNAFSIPGLPVDTHVRRVSKRIGLTTNNAPEKIEKDLMELYSKKDWILLSHSLIFHGRRICRARKPLCPVCTLQNLCDYFKERV